MHGMGRQMPAERQHNGLTSGQSGAILPFVSVLHSPHAFIITNIPQQEAAPRHQWDSAAASRAFASPRHPRAACPCMSRRRMTHCERRGGQRCVPVPRRGHCAKGLRLRQVMAGQGSHHAHPNQPGLRCPHHWRRMGSDFKLRTDADVEDVYILGPALGYGGTRGPLGPWHAPAHAGTGLH